MSHAERWRSHRFWNRLGIVAVFALLPLVALGAFLAQRSSDLPALPYLLVLMWLLALGGMLFSVHGGWFPYTAHRKCVHCALELDL